MAERLMDPVRLASILTAADEQVARYKGVDPSTESALKEMGWNTFADSLRHGSHISNDDLSGEMEAATAQVPHQREVLTRYTENVTGRQLQLKELVRVEAKAAGLLVASGNLFESNVRMWASRGLTPQSGYELPLSEQDKGRLIRAKWGNRE